MRNSAVLLVVLVIGLVIGGTLYAAGSTSDNPEVVLLSSDVELRVVSPFVVSLFLVGTDVELDETKTGTVYHGQQIAEGIFRVENRSPFDYGARIRVAPQEVLSDTWPYFEVRVWEGKTLLRGPKTIPAGETIELRVEVSIPYETSFSVFRGLKIIVSTVPPPTETTVECPSGGECG